MMQPPCETDMQCQEKETGGQALVPSMQLGPIRSSL